MKKCSSLIIAFAIIYGIFNITIPAAQANESVDRKTFNIATDTTYAPFEFKKDNEYVGIDIDLIKEIAKESDFDINIKPIGFDAAVQALDSGQIDGIIAGMTITETRKEKFDFSNTYFESGIVMGVKDDSSISNYEDLKNKTVAVKTGTSGAMFADSIKSQYGFKIKVFNDSADMINDVKSGNSDALIEDYPVIAYMQKQNSGIKQLGKKQNSTPYGFAVKKNENSDLLMQFNQGLEKLKINGNYDKILNKYLASENSEINQASILDLFLQNFPFLAQGLSITLILALASLIISLFLGIIFGLFRISHNTYLNYISIVYVDIFRGTPLIIQAFFIYFGVPAILNIQISGILAGIITLSLNAGAYMVEIIRGGIQSIDKGQMEAGRSLGLPYNIAMKKIVIPQAVKTMMPSFINQFIITFKDTSILSVIGIIELTQSGKIIIANNFESFRMWLIIAVIYFIIIMTLSKLSAALEKRTQYA